MRDAAALDALAARLEAHGVAVRRGSRRLAAERHVADLILFEDPAETDWRYFTTPQLRQTLFNRGDRFPASARGRLAWGMRCSTSRMSSRCSRSTAICWVSGSAITG